MRSASAVRGHQQTEHVLAILERIEEEAGKLYAWFSQVFADDTEANELFERLSQEEARHRDLVRFQRQLARRGGASQSSNENGDEGTNEESKDLPVVLRAIIDFRTQNPFPTLREAVQFAMGLENSPAEAKYRTAIADTNPNMAKLINSLNNGDNHHAEVLFGFAKRRDLL